MARPTKSPRQTKELGEALPSVPANKKLTFTEVNEDDATDRAIIDYLPIFVVSDSLGIIEGYVVNEGDIHYNILTGKHIGAIIQLGSGVTFAEYDPALDGGATMFSKDLDEVAIMEAATHIPMTFTPNTAYLLFPR